MASPVYEYTYISLMSVFIATCNGYFLYHEFLLVYSFRCGPQLVTLKKDPSKTPKQWIQAPEFVPVSFRVTVICGHNV